MDIGGAIREIRQAKKITQTVVAARLGLTTNFISMVERGLRGVNPKTLEDIAKALRVPTAYIYILADDSKDVLLKTVQDTIRKTFVRTNR